MTHLVRRSQLGVTLIELLIGLAIGVLVVLAALSLLLNITNASARVYQSHELSDAMRTSLSLVEQTVAEAGFGISDSTRVIDVSATVTGVDITNGVTVRSRPVAEPVLPTLPAEIVTCVYGVVQTVGVAPRLEINCNGAPVTVANGIVAFEVHSGCTDALTGRVVRYRRANCLPTEFRRSIRLATLVRANASDPVRDRRVADDSYTFPATVESPSGAVYTVPTGTTGVANGCDGSGDCRTYRHRLVVTEVIPRNELIRARVAF
jgi:hypothetical protein